MNIHRTLSICLFLLLGGMGLQAQPLALLDTIAANNLGLRSLRAGVKATGEEARASLRLPDPEAEVAYLLGSPSAVPNRTNVGLKQELPWTMLTGRQKSAAEATTALAEMDFETAHQAVVAAGLDLLVQLVHFNRLEAEMAQRLRTADEVEALCRKRYAQGDLTVLELNKARLNRAVAEAELRRVTTDREGVARQLQQLNGGLPLVCTDTAYAFGVAEWCAPLVDFPAQQTAAVRRAEASVKQREAELQLARTRRLPSLTVGFVGEYIPDNNYSGLSLGVSLPLWGSTRANVRSSEANLLAAQLDRADAQLSVSAEAGRLRTEALRLDGVARELSEALSATESAALLQRSLDLGQISLLDYLLELSFFYTARTAWLEADRDAHQAAAAFRALAL